MALPRVEHGLVAYSLDELLKTSFPARRTLLCRDDTAVFREGHIGEVYAPRGVGKTWFLQTLALVVSAGVEALGFSAPEPSRVLYVDGEMAADDIQKRFEHLCEILQVQRKDALTVIGRDWQPEFLPRVDTPDGEAALSAHVEEADLIILDNRSCLFDPEGETDPAAWQPAQDSLLSLRRRGKGVLLAHHANRMGGARGHSKPEDAMDLLLKLSRPDGYVQDQGARFLVEFDKARGVHGPAASPFVASLTERGWDIEGASRAEEDKITRKLSEHLALADRLGERPQTATAAVRGAGVNKAKGLRALEGLVKSRQVIKDKGYRLA